MYMAAHRQGVAYKVAGEHACVCEPSQHLRGGLCGEGRQMCWVVWVFLLSPSVARAGGAVRMFVRGFVFCVS